MPSARDPESALAHAGHALYGAFRQYRGLRNWGDCLDNRSPEDDLCVVHHNVCDLPDAHYLYYGWHSVTVNLADTPALKYFFPRVLHEAALPLDRETVDGNAPLPLPLELYIGEMIRHDWQRWPDDERAAIAHFFKAWFNACLAHPFWPFWNDRSFHRPERYAEDVLRLAASLRLDLGPFLDEWASDESSAATSQLLCIIRDHANSIATHATLHGWEHGWGSTGADRESIGQVVRFLTSPRIYSRLERAFFAAAEANVQSELSAAVDQLRNIYEIWNRTLRGTGQIPAWAEDVAGEMCKAS
jgi:hypothetical protein